MRDEEKERVRREVSKLIQDYAELLNAERLEGDREPVYVNGWVCFAEYESTSLLAADVSASINMYPQEQPRSMSLGLYELGAAGYKA